MLNFLNIIKRKGLVETLFVLEKKTFDVLFSSFKILAYKIRGYRISSSVTIRGDNTFFQSTKGAIRINHNSTIGKGVRITCGGEGIITINEKVHIDDYTFIMAHEKIEIGKNTSIAAFCFITDFNHKFKQQNVSVLEQGYETKPIVIGKNVWIGTHCIILPGVTIGDGSVIGAGSVVTKNISNNSIAVGNPAKVVKIIKRNAKN